MTPRAIELYKVAVRTHETLTRLRIELEREVRVCYDERELADSAYALDKAFKLTDDARRQIAALNRLAEQMACVKWATSATRYPNGEPIRTEHVTASPSSKIAVKVPKQHEDPEGYAQLMDYLGVKPELYAGRTEALRPHWPGLVEYLTDQAALGKSLPPGVDPHQTSTHYSLTLRGKKEVDE